MTSMWIILAVAAAVLVGWRLRLASGRLDRILRDEPASSEAQSLPASHDR
jgi:hypothetical protein